MNETALSSVKWSVRLYFYVCYGFNASQLIQYLKRRDPQILTKESFTVNQFHLYLNSFTTIKKRLGHSCTLITSNPQNCQIVSIMMVAICHQKNSKINLLILCIPINVEKKSKNFDFQE